MAFLPGAFHRVASHQDRQEASHQDHQEASHQGAFRQEASRQEAFRQEASHQVPFPLVRQEAFHPGLDGKKAPWGLNLEEGEGGHWWDLRPVRTARCCC